MKYSSIISCLLFLSGEECAIVSNVDSTSRLNADDDGSLWSSRQHELYSSYKFLTVLDSFEICLASLFTIFWPSAKTTDCPPKHTHKNQAQNHSSFNTHWTISQLSIWLPTKSSIILTHTRRIIWKRVICAWFPPIYSPTHTLAIATFQFHYALFMCLLKSSHFMCHALIVSCDCLQRHFFLYCQVLGRNVANKDVSY